MARTKHPADGLALFLGEEETEIGQLLSLDPISSERETIEATVFRETHDDALKGIEVGATVKAMVAYDPENESHLDLEEEFASDDSNTWYVEDEETGDKWAIPAIMNQLDRIGGERNGLLTRGFTIKIVSPGVSRVEESS